MPSYEDRVLGRVTLTIDDEYDVATFYDVLERNMTIVSKDTLLLVLQQHAEVKELQGRLKDSFNRPRPENEKRPYQHTIVLTDREFSVVLACMGIVIDGSGS